MSSHPFLVFSTSICSEAFDTFSQLLFYLCPVFLELLQYCDRCLLFERIDMCHPGTIVDEKDIILGSSITYWFDGSTQIAVDELEGLLGPCCRFVRWLPMLFSF